ncbi:MAG: 3-isopropylmalate dehydratase small subunit [Acetobacteraceae bacterium]|nr:3-isopropylmalate dehydratase small subunit [Acetobacteraceae bacterium]
MNLLKLVRQGRAWCFGDQVDTDQVLPGRYMGLGDPARAARHLMEGLDPEFGAQVRPGDIIVAGRNFGLGSTRGQALLAMKAAGLGGIVAESFSRIFFRGCISEGIPVLECPGIRGLVATGDEVKVDFGSGEVCNLSTGRSLRGRRLEGFMLERLAQGGSLAFLRSRGLVGGCEGGGDPRGGGGPRGDGAAPSAPRAER